MYQKFFGLAESPFNLTPDSRFLYLSEKHREALANLIYGVRERKGFITLTGEIGSGKTTLCRALTNELDSENTRLAIIFNSYLSEIELLQTINEDLGIPYQFNSRKDLISELNQYLLEENQKGHNVVLIIDEAQNLSIQVLEQIRMLSNLETETDKLIQIVLMGQPELLDKLARPELEQLNQRITVRYHIKPLDKKDVEYYIRHRLNVARAQIDIDFTPEALKLIYEYTGGVPRKINVLCDRCLLAAYAKVTYTIDLGIVKSAVQEIEGEKRPKVREPETTGAKESLTFKHLILLMPVLGIIIAGGVFLGIRFASGPDSEVPAGAATEKNTEPPRPSYLQPEDIAPPDPEPGAIASTSTLAQNSETDNKEKTTEKKEPKQYHYHWQYDSNEICRIDNPDMAYQASLITWLQMWNIEVDPEPLREMEEETIKSFDIAGNAKLGLRKIETGPDLSAASRFDIPLILVYEKPPENISPVTVLKRMEGISCTIADPIYGLKTIRKNKIEQNLEKCVLLYFDKNNLDAILKGEESGRVAKVQEYLKENDYYKGAVNGLYNAGTRSAIRNFQRFHDLETTGYIDRETALMLSTRMITMRPRLYSSGGEM